MKKSLILLIFLFSFASHPLCAGDGWSLVADDYTARYYGVPIANGVLGLTPGKAPFQIKNVILGNLYDTRREGDISRLVYALNPFGLVVSVDGKEIDAECVSDWSQTLDMRKAVLKCSFSVEGKARISYEVRALRCLPYCGLVSVRVEALQALELGIRNEIKATKDFKGVIEGSFKQDLHGKDYVIENMSAVTANRGIGMVASSCLFTSEGQCPSVRTLPEGGIQEFHLLCSVCSGQDFLDPRNEADREVLFGVGEGVERLIARHEAAWNNLWRGDIIIEGDEHAQKIVRSALFHLYSACREGCSASIPPFGFSCREYNGHIFWDSEIWMYPPILFLNEGIAESMMEYRIDRLDAARQRALAYGYKGAMFPWESDYAGDESCPTSASTGVFEQHISADVAIGAWNYYRMTRDMDWLRVKGYPLLREVARFLVSRAEGNADGSYSINNIICADEFAKGVDDNAFTNGSAIVALRAAISAATLCGETADPAWSRVADGLRLLKGPHGITLEYEGYDGRVIKQADANLLAYPLALVTEPQAVRRDLKYYESRIDPHGPAMSYAILALQWARLGEGAKAYELFSRALEGHLHGPFLAFSETAGQGDTFFMTGLGGVLQAVINGFCGLELTDEGVVQLPSALPKTWKSVTVTGVGPERRTYSVK